MKQFEYLNDQPPKSRCSTGNIALYHYSNYYGLTGIVSSKSIWCTKIQYLNDASELRHGFDTLISVAKDYIEKVPALASLATSAHQVRGVNVVLSRLRSGLSTHLGSLSFEGQGAFAT